jgi:hypothetical protein
MSNRGAFFFLEEPDGSAARLGGALKCSSCGSMNLFKDSSVAFHSICPERGASYRMSFSPSKGGHDE